MLGLVASLACLQVGFTHLVVGTAHPQVDYVHLDMRQQSDFV